MNPFEDISEQAQKWHLDDEGIDVTYDAAFLDDETASRLFEALKNEIAWQRHVMQTPGGPKTVPRMISWHADEGFTYSYSGLLHQWQPWTPALREIREKLEEHLGLKFNGVLANFYENEQDSVGPHADDETDMIDGAAIASVSLGETRQFIIKHRETGSRHVIPLEHGSLLVMAGRTQKVSRHAVPKAKYACGPRINLTFRQTKNS